MAAKGPDPLLHGLRAAALLVLGLVAYSDSLNGPFIFDDEYAVPDNPRLASSSPWQWLKSPPQSAAAGRPVVAWSIAFNYALDDFDVWGYHALNLALHLASGLLVYGIARRTFQSPALASRFGASARALAWIIAAIWLVHPLQTEAVSYIIQRTELLMGLFYLLTLYAAIRAWDGGHAGRWTWISAGACVLGMASKEVMVSAPLMVVLYDRAFRVSSFREAFRRRRNLYLLLAGSWLVLGSLMALMPRANSVGFGLGMSSWQYALTQCWAIARYLRLSFWPRGLCLDYGEQPVTDLAHCLPGGILLFCLALATLWGWWRRPAWGFLGAWFFLILAPSSSIVPIVTEVAAERRMYLPLAAVVAAVVVSAYELGRRAMSGSQARLRRFWPYRNELGWGLALSVILSFAATTFARNLLYEDPVELWSDTIAKTPDNPRSHNSLGKVLFNRGEFASAERQYREAIRLDGQDADFYHNLGAALAQQGHLDQAVAEYRAAIRLDPADSSAYNNLAIAYEQQGHRAEAVKAYQAALAVDSNLPKVRMNYGILLTRQQKFEAAEQQFRIVIAQYPQLARPYNLLSAVLAGTGRKVEAEEAVRRAIELDPQFADAWDNLAKLLFARSDQGRDRAVLKEAFDAIQRALSIAPLASSPHNTLAILLAATGQREQAVAQCQMAVKLDPNNADAKRNLAALSGGS